MARFVATDEKIEEINKLYYEIGVKKRVAEIVGCSPATVSKYIIPGWRPPADFPEVDIQISEPEGPGDLILAMSCHPVSAAAAFCEFCKLSDEEWYGMKQVQEDYVSV